MAKNRDHAFLSASGSHRWLVCTPSAQLEAQFPQETSVYAEEGTLAHSLGELNARYCLKEISKKTYESRKAKLLQTEAGQKYYCKEMEEYMIDYASYIWDRLQNAKQTTPDAFCELETKLDFSVWVPDGFGTGDCVIIQDGLLEIIDLKYGKGHKVEAEGNTQMRLYALGAYTAYRDLFEFSKVRMTIFQPRAGGVSSDEISVKELLTWAENYVLPRALLASAGSGEFAPTEEACRFCRARGCCRARSEKNLKFFHETPDRFTITPDEAGRILSEAGDITAWLEDLESYVKETLAAGTPVEGWKLVLGKSNRKLPPEEKVVELMTAAGIDQALLYEKNLLTLTDFEKNFGKKKIAEILGKYITKPEGKPTLAPASDKREAWSPKEAVLKAFDEGAEQ